MELTKEALQYLIELSRVITVNDDGEEIHLLIMKPDGSYTEESYPKPPIERGHNFMSLDGFLEFLKSNKAPSNGIIFIGAKFAYADLAYGGHVTQYAELALTHSREYLALQELFDGVGQKELWRLLIGDLDGCVDPVLELTISAINVKANQESTIQIDHLGTESGESKNQVIITYPDAKGGASARAGLPERIAWKGRIFECLEKESEIILRLEVDKYLRFFFHPRRIERVKADARRMLVAKIRADIAAEKQWLVVDGEFSPPEEEIEG